jgi:hypothetical protein
MYNDENLQAGADPGQDRPPASFRYQITVQGRVDKRFLHLLGNLKLDETSFSKETVTVLTGEVEDQAALSGILETLIDNRYSLISVLKLNS